MTNDEFLRIAKICGNNIKEARILRGYKTQKDFALAMLGGSNYSTSISRLESGKNNEFKQYVKIAQLLQVPISYIFKSNTPLDEKYINKLSVEEQTIFELNRIGELLKKIRLSKHKVLADFEKGVGIGIDSSNVSKIERGVINLKLYTLIALCTELGIQLEDLF